MDALLLLIAINFLVVPFLQEAEAQGRELRRFPGFLRLLRLSHMRRSHWLRPFCIFAALFLLLALARAQSAQRACRRPPRADRRDRLAASILTDGGGAIAAH